MLAYMSRRDRKRGFNMKLSNNQIQELKTLTKWYPKKVTKVYEQLIKGKITLENFWNEARKITKSIKSDNSLREWQIIFENIENILKDDKDMLK